MGKLTLLTPVGRDAEGGTVLFKKEHNLFQRNLFCIKQKWKCGGDMRYRVAEREVLVFY